MTQPLAEHYADRPLIMLTLRPEPGVDVTRALRALLKSALRQHRLRCVAIATGDPDADRAEGDRLPGQPDALAAEPSGTKASGSTPKQELCEIAQNHVPLAAPTVML